MKSCFEIEEKVIIQYVIYYDENELEKLGYDSLKDYIDEKGNGNPWTLIGVWVIQDIVHEMIVEYLDANYGQLHFC